MGHVQKTGINENAQKTEFQLYRCHRPDDIFGDIQHCGIVQPVFLAAQRESGAEGRHGSQGVQDKCQCDCAQYTADGIK